MRETTLVENQLINEQHYVTANKISEPILPLQKKKKLGISIFHLLQNSLSSLEKNNYSIK